MSVEEKSEIDEMVAMLRPLSCLDRKLILSNIIMLQIRAEVEREEKETHNAIAL